SSGSAVRGCGVGIEGDGVDLAVDAAQELGQSFCIVDTVVHTLEENVLECDQPTLGLREVPYRGQEFLDVPAGVDRHDFVADGVRRRVERHGQSYVFGEPLA